MRPGLTKVVTFPPGGGYGIALDMIGHVSPARYSFATPGGCDQLSLTMYDPPRKRSEALAPGRLTRGYRGGSVCWEGILDEPSPSAQGGWSITAHGQGGAGADYVARWTGSWSGTVADTCVNNAIADGLGWVNPGIGSPSGLWLGQAVDSGAQDITTLLNLITSKGGLTWSVVTGPGGNVLSVYPLPTVPNRILISTTPVAQSIATGPDKLYIRYQATADTTKVPATYGLTSVVQQDQVDAQGMRQDYMDLSSAGQRSAASAQAVGNQVLKRFTRAGFTDAFPARYGQLTSMGGTQVDPGVFWADGITAMVIQVLLADFAFAGEVARGPVQFMVSGYEWDDGAMTAAITPAGSMRHDFSSLMSAAVDQATPRTQPVKKKKKGR